jgi:hypothetical protein
MSNTPGPEWADGWSLIHSYTRADMLADGSLITIPAQTARRYGLKAPLAITRAIYLAHVWDSAAPTGKDDDTGRDFTPHEQRRLHAPLRAIASELQRAAGAKDKALDTDRLTVPYNEETVIFHLGPGDQGEPVFTIMTRQDA